MWIERARTGLADQHRRKFKMNQATGNVFIKYNPYKIETIVRFDSLDGHGGEEPKESNSLHSSHLNGAGGKNGKRLQEWIDNLPSILEKSGREKSYTVTFYGTTLDFEDIKAVADCSSVITKCEHIQGCNPEDKITELKKLFKDACALNFDSISDYGEEIDKAFQTGFEAHVVATMSAGKSTLINALLGKKLMPSENQACTAVVTRICDTDSGSGVFSADAFGPNEDKPRKTIKELTYNEMANLNSDENITNIVIKGDIPFVEAKGMPFVIVDTPGPNNSRNTNHSARTLHEINAGKQSFIIFLLDATQNGTKDEKLLLEEIAKAMKKGGKMSRDRFLFVINKVDNFSGEPENITGLLIKNRDGLAQPYGITDARIYPVSAAVALSAATGLDKASKKDKANAETMVEIPQLHLEQAIEGINSHIPASARDELAKRLAEAVAESDLGTQALIHSGVPSLQAAIKEYIEKYARAMRIGEIANKLQESFDCAEKVAELNADITEDGEKRDNILAAIDKLENEIKSGEQGRPYEAQLSEWIKNALSDVEKKIEEQERSMSESVSTYCDQHKEHRLSPSKAREISRDWIERFKHTEDVLKNSLSDLLNQGIKLNAEKFLDDYRKKIEAIMPRDEVGALPFDPLSLLGAEMALDSTIDRFVTQEQKSRQVQTGTIVVRNPERKGFFGFFKVWKPWSVDEPVYKTEYYTEEHVEWIRYSQDIIGKVRAGITSYCREAKEQAKSNSDKMFDDFKNKFKRLNDKILQKTAELKAMSKNDETLKDRIAQNKQLVEDVERLQKRLNNILEIERTEE